MKRLNKILIVFLLGFSVGFSLNNNLNFESNLNENSITLINSLRGGTESNSNKKTAFVRIPPSQKYSGEQSTNTKPVREIPTKIGYKTALSGGKKLPDNPGSGSWDTNNQDNEDEFSWKNIQKDPEVWSNYQQYCKDSSKKNKQCDLIQIESKIKEDSSLVKYAEYAGKDQRIQRDLNGLIEQLRLGNESLGIGQKTLFKGIKKACTRSGARIYYRKKNGKIEILAKSNKKTKYQNTVIQILRKKYE